MKPQQRLTDKEHQELEPFLQANPLLAEASALKEKFLSLVSHKDGSALDARLD